MLSLRRFSLATAILIGLAVEAAAAEMVCGRHEAFVSYLAQTHHESPQAIGLTDGGLMLEVFVSSDGGWTILLTNPEGLACVLAFGEAWDFVLPEKPEI